AMHHRLSASTDSFTACPFSNVVALATLRKTRGMQYRLANYLFGFRRADLALHIEATIGKSHV
ncbi:MAG: hypothetical protein KJN79_02185, partial [Gammaproteobacteria bacterium]|nr:hypothetical protein [Gammaproteobacteria bacterium]